MRKPVLFICWEIGNPDKQVAGLLLTDAAVCELPKEDAPMGGGVPGGMGMDM
ncbi:hypothetical protein [Paraburkholderia phytofirmans]|uniref:hypothetical protein n=1 Tax=Paraburkholderia phytofirmans TaxID=261302 RepID=UPI001314DEE8|nr:hypothetical protein [Paraburkholderia phytofirmans]